VCSKIEKIDGIMKNQIVSIIVPIYNSEKYLSKCIDSILHQNYKELQVILVDDGSTDKSGGICDNYRNMDPRVLVIHKANGGMSDARNEGLRHVIGYYTTFVDSDDYISPNMISSLLDTMNKHHADISICAIKKVYNYNCAPDDSCTQEIVQFSGEQAVENLDYHRVISASLPGKLFRSELFVGLTFAIGKRYEDLGVIYILLLNAKIVCYSPRIMYYYYQRHSSVMHQKFDAHSMDRIEMSQNQILYIKEDYPSLLIAAYTRLFISTVQTLRIIPLLGNRYRSERKVIRKLIKQYRFIVAKNCNAKLETRLIAVLSYLGIIPIYILGPIWKIINRNK
jgi:glycosyltransferase involved in cell wall biosynthesis